MTKDELSPNGEYLLSPSQAQRLLALSVMLKDGELAFQGDDASDQDAAYEAILDVGQEIALQMGGTA